MAVAYVQGRQAGSSGTSVTVTTTTAPMAGNLLLFSISVYRSANATAPTVATPSGWTLLGTSASRNPTSGIWNVAYAFARLAASGETTTVATAALAGASAYRYAIEEWSGVGFATPDVSASPVADTSSATGAMLASALTTMKTDMFVWTMFAQRTTSSTPTLTWGGGSVQATNGANQNAVATAWQMVSAPNSVSPSVTYSNTTNVAANLLTFGFPTATSQSAVVDALGFVKVYVNGVWVPYPVKVFENGVWTTGSVKAQDVTSGSWITGKQT